MLKILVMFTGGTIASTLSAGIIDTDNNKPYELIEKYKVIDDSITFETSEPYFILSENLSGERITKLVKSVKDAGNTQLQLVQTLNTRHFVQDVVKF